MTFQDADLQQIEAKGISLDEINQQFKNFKNTFPFINIEKPATVEDGITSLNLQQVEQFAKAYLKQHKVETIKFVPASGAATRMFKALHEFVQNYESTKTKVTEIPDNIKLILSNLENFAFFKKLHPYLKEASIQTENTLNDIKKTIRIINLILNQEGLNYNKYPKALIEFHDYSYETRTSLEEQIIEAIHYVRQKNNAVKLHFTISKEHENAIQNKIDSLKYKYDDKYGINLIVDLSVQKENTDTIAVDENLNPIRDVSDKLVFRPGGHGTLIENLNELNADIIFIKNIDNVCQDHLREQTYLYKQALAGLLVTKQEKIFYYLNLLEDKNIGKNTLCEILEFANTELNQKLSISENSETFRLKLIEVLNRPTRICGMVENKGQVGGGPFWVKGKNDNTSLQIIESAQIDLKNPIQNEIFSNATHFNPVDLVCGVKDYKGNRFNLFEFIDHNTGFITKKTREGKTVVAQEKPGLWNGAMALWNTIFVEVPAESFTPVKSVDNLLNSAHIKEIDVKLQNA